MANYISIMILEFIQVNSIFIISGLTLVCSLFIKSFIQEHGKLKAQRIENKKLVEEAEKIKAQFNIQLEEIRKEHQLDLSKRRYKYESKKEQYIRFYQLIDQFSFENNVKMQSKLIVALEEFNKTYLEAAMNEDKEKEVAAVSNLSKRMLEITMEANQYFMKLKQETNTIKMIASDNILEKLNQLNLAFDYCFTCSNKLMTDLPALMLSKNQHEMLQNQQLLEASGVEIKKLNEEIIDCMRSELNEI